MIKPRITSVKIGPQTCFVAGLLQALTRSQPDDVGIGGGQGDVADTQGRLVFEDGLPDQPVIDGLPEVA